MVNQSEHSCPLRIAINFIVNKLRIINVYKFHVFKKRYSPNSNSQCVQPKLGSLRIRIIAPDDIPKISQKLGANFQKIFNDGNGGFVATVNGNLVHWSLFGYKSVRQKTFVGIIRLNLDSAYIYSVHTDPMYRGCNIAPCVLDAICNYLYPEGITKFYSFILTDNKSSINAFFKAGFRNIGTVHTFLVLNFRFCKIIASEENKFDIKYMLNFSVPIQQLSFVL